MRQHTLIVSETPSGGVRRLLTSSISDFFRSFRHLTASSRAGTASSRSRCASSAADRQRHYYRNDQLDRQRNVDSVVDPQ